ncbi:LptF/LptG family permease [Treponema sp.]|uniref:LptF/LptG family permease n=1 Tax=Treponema sp. TaxID=166 RepID=UPI00298D7B19|nr:LptF/LptG family permease [Treponema sp.]MCR5612380.1 LptF/LptG family permease [Treponema sp.]
MKLALYIFRLFFPLLLGALSLFILGFEIVDLFMNIWKYIFNNVPVNVVLKTLLLYLPKTITYALPLSMLFATCYMLCILSAQNELVALFASGVSYIRVMLPLIIFSFILSICYFVFEDKVVVPCYSQYQTLKNDALHIEQELNSTNIVIRSEDGLLIYKAEVYEDAVMRLHGVLIVIRTEDKKLEAIVKAPSAQWDKNQERWVLSSPSVYRLLANGELEYSRSLGNFAERFVEAPETFRNNKVDVETVTIKEAREYIGYLKRTGRPTGESLSVYYKKFSFSYVIMIVTILAIGLSGRSRRNVIIISMLLSLTASVLFYVLQMVTMLLAKFGFVTPAFGAWFPVIVFMIISGALLRYSRT